ncbi:hypothetical protein GQ85_19860 [Rhodococcus rhodochrous]|nr:hypothetical protein GQ85_19860 [Rhodococcus rhodochrous]
MSTDPLREANLTLAVIAAVRAKLDRAEADAKAALKAHLPRGTAYVYDGLGEDDAHQLGVATVPKPTAAKPKVVVDDEARVLPWAIDTFGDSAATYRLTPQGLTSVTAYAIAAWEQAGKPGRLEVDGLTVTAGVPGKGTPRFTPSKRVEEQVEAMVRDGRLSLTDLLALPAPTTLREGICE